MPAEKRRPLLGLNAARNSLKAAYKNSATAASRSAAMTRILGLAMREKNQDPKVISLIERARLREIKKVPSRAAVARGETSPFRFPENYAGKQFKFVNERIFDALEDANAGRARADCHSLVSLAKKLRCQKFAGEYFEDLAQKMRGIMIGAAEKRVHETAKELFFGSLDFAITMFKESGETQKARQLEIYAGNMAKTL